MLKVWTPVTDRTAMQQITLTGRVEVHGLLVAAVFEPANPIPNNRHGDESVSSAAAGALFPRQSPSSTGQRGGNHAPRVPKTRDDSERQEGLGSAAVTAAAALDHDFARAIEVVHVPDVAAPQHPAASAAPSAGASESARCYAGRGASSLASGAHPRSGGCAYYRQSMAAGPQSREVG